MADQKISELNELETLADDDLLVVVDTNVSETKKITKINVKGQINATHTGEVTGDGELTVADNVIDEANLKVNSPTNDYVLTADSGEDGGMKWAAASGGGGIVMIILSKTTDTNQDVGGANGTEVFWTWNTEVRKDTGFTHSTESNSERVQVDADGWYRIRFLGNAQQTGANRTTLQGIYRINGGSTLLNGTIRDYTRGSGYGNLSPGLEYVFELSDGDYIEVGTKVEDTDGAYTINTNDGTEITNGESVLILEKIS